MILQSIALIITPRDTPQVSNAGLYFVCPVGWDCRILSVGSNAYEKYFILIYILTQSAGAVEYTDCISVEKSNLPQRVS